MDFAGAGASQLMRKWIREEFTLIKRLRDRGIIDLKEERRIRHEIQIPEFHGRNVEDWIFRLKEISHFFRLTDDEMLKVAIIGLTGEAWRDFEWEHQRRPFHGWTEVEVHLRRRFSPTSLPLWSPLSNMMKLGKGGRNRGDAAEGGRFGGHPNLLTVKDSIAGHGGFVQLAGGTKGEVFMGGSENGREDGNFCGARSTSMNTDDEDIVGKGDGGRPGGARRKAAEDDNGGAEKIFSKDQEMAGVLGKKINILEDAVEGIMVICTKKDNSSKNIFSPPRELLPNMNACLGEAKMSGKIIKWTGPTTMTASPHGLGQSTVGSTVLQWADPILNFPNTSLKSISSSFSNPLMGKEVEPKSNSLSSKPNFPNQFLNPHLSTNPPLFHHSFILILFNPLTKPTQLPNPKFIYYPFIFQLPTLETTTPPMFQPDSLTYPSNLMVLPLEEVNGFFNEELERRWKPGITDDPIRHCRGRNFSANYHPS